jgi:hypothetical protein
MPDDGNISIFNCATGVFTQVAGLVTSATADNLGNGWYRVKLVALAVASSNVSVGIAQAAVNVPFSATGTEFAIIGPAQLNRGSVPTAYLPTTTAARVGLALDYDPVTHAAKGLLCEPQATNLAKQSAGLLGTISPWDSSGGATYTASAQTDPAGGLAAIQVAVTSNTGNNYAQNISSLTNGAVYTASMWVKGTASQQIYFSANSSQNGAHNQLVTFTGAWQRVSSTVTVNATNAYLAFECYNRASPGSSLPNVTFHVWGAQFETGAVATSYIPTLAATVTRAGDDPNVVPSAFPAVLPVNSMFADVTMLSDVGAVLAINNGSHAESMGFYYQIVWSYYVRTGSAYQANLSPAPTTAVAKLAARAAANDFALCMNGGAVDTDTAGAMPTAAANRLHLSGVGGPIGPGGFYLRSIVIVPRLWSNAELIAKTA